MDKLIIGRYIPGESMIHGLDPRSKLLAMFSFVVIIFWANNLITNLILATFCLTMVFLSKIKLSFFLSGLKPMIGIILFTTSFQLFFTKGGTIYWQYGILSLSSYGIAQTGIIFARFILLITFSTLLSLTTMPLSLADAIESLLAPLRPFKVPVHEIGLMLSMSLRFVPTLMDDTQRIMNAQRARGVEFNEGNMLRKIRAMIPILVPLFASSIKRADSLAIAMEARGYQGGQGRTKYRILSWKFKDSLCLVVMVFLAFLIYHLKS